MSEISNFSLVTGTAANEVFNTAETLDESAQAIFKSQDNRVVKRSLAHGGSDDELLIQNGAGITVNFSVADIAVLPASGTYELWIYDSVAGEWVKWFNGTITVTEGTPSEDPVVFEDGYIGKTTSEVEDVNALTIKPDYDIIQAGADKRVYRKNAEGEYEAEAAEVPLAGALVFDGDIFQNSENTKVSLNARVNKINARNPMFYDKGDGSFSSSKIAFDIDATDLEAGRYFFRVSPENVLADVIADNAVVGAICTQKFSAAVVGKEEDIVWPNYRVCVSSLELYEGQWGPGAFITIPINVKIYDPDLMVDSYDAEPNEVA